MAIYSRDTREALPEVDDRERRLRQRLGWVFADHELYSEAGDPFADQRAAVKAPIRRLFTTFGRRYWRSFGLGLGAGVIARFADLLPPLILGLAIDAIFTAPPSRLTLPVVPDALIPASQLGQFWVAAGFIAAAFVLSAVFNWLRSRGLNAFAQNVQHDLRTQTYDRIQRLKLSFFDEKQTGELMSILSSNVNDLNSFLKDSLDKILHLVVTLGGVSLILFSINWQLAIVTLAVTPLLAVFTLAYIRMVKPRYKRVRESLADLFSRLENNLTGIQVIKTSNTEDFERERVAAASDEYRDRNWDVIRLSTLFGPSQQAVAGMTFVLTFVIGGLWVFSGPPLFLSGDLTVGEFVAFILLSQQFIGPMAQFGNILDNYQKTYASAERVFGLLDEIEAAETDAADADTLSDTDGRVAYDDVSFSYGPRQVLQGVNFIAEPGDSVALVGPSGSGKSTVLKLLPRLYETDTGTISVDGTPVTSFTRHSLRQAIGYVSQDPFLFSGTIRDNITYGVENATDTEMIDAAKAANAHRFIENMEQDYETEVGPRGGKLSGGQRQRLSIARAILRNPEILILDEATSAVDTETELLIQKALERVTEDRTTFAIAHRLSTIRDADTILVMEDGRIVERGTHDELLDTDGLYAHLWQVQTGLLDDLPREFVERAAARAARLKSGN